jgi:hypothetical protein
MPSTLRKIEIAGFPIDSHSFLSKSNQEWANPSEILPHLEELHIQLDWITEEPWMERMPETLKILSVGHWNTSILLPKSVETFKCWLICISPEASLIFPDNLTSLEFSEVEGFLSELIPALPESLTHLSIHRFQESTLSYYMLAQLPRQLRYLQCHLDYYSDLDSDLPPSIYSVLPSTLETLKLMEFPLEQCTALPRGLRTFNLLSRENPDNLNQTEYQDSLISLPPNLTKLSFEYNSLVTIPTALPKLDFLTSLDLWRVYVPPSGMDSIQNILPQSLLHLKLMNMNGDIAKILPRKLRSLTSSHVSLSPDLLQNLPQSLTKVHFNAGSSRVHIYDMSKQETLMSLPPSPSINHDLLWDPGKGTCLPPGITSLSWRGFTGTNDAFFRQLPKALSFLQISDICAHDHAIAYISNHPIQALEIRNQSELTGACFKFLPKGLEKLDFTGAQIYNAHIANLPRSVTHLCLPHATHLTRKCLSLLPPRLLSFGIEHNKHIQPQDLPLFPFKLQVKSLWMGYFYNAKFSIRKGHMEAQGESSLEDSE